MLFQVRQQLLLVNGALLKAALHHYSIPEEDQGWQTVHLQKIREISFHQ